MTKTGIRMIDKPNLIDAFALMAPTAVFLGMLTWWAWW